MLKYTKTELRGQQYRLGQLHKYLPTLQLKKVLLQMEVNAVLLSIEALGQELEVVNNAVKSYAPLLSDTKVYDLFSSVEVHAVQCGGENIAGVELPIYEDTLFCRSDYSLFDTPVWLEGAIEGLKKLIRLREAIKVAERRKTALEKELREVSIRVNLFEKILIPRAEKNIRRIKIFLGDQQLAAVSQAKVAKKKMSK